jgi:peptide/nickel transport system permease protein
MTSKSEVHESSVGTLGDGPIGAGAPDVYRYRVPNRSRAIVRRVTRKPSAVVGFIVFSAWIAVAASWPLLVPYDPNAIDLPASFSSPSATHWFGTDDLGRDVFSRVLAGSRSVVLVATVATVLGVAVGTTLGIVAGYSGGVIDEALMRVVDVAMAFPIVLLSLLVIAVLGPSKLNVILVVAFVFVPFNARVTRSAVLTERNRDYVSAARMRGETRRYIMFAEIFPNITGTIVVELTIRLAFAIFTVATLSFLGLGIQPPTPDWGLMIAQGRQFYSLAPWIVLFPSIAIASLAIAVNLIAEGLRK